MGLTSPMPPCAPNSVGRIFRKGEQVMAVASPSITRVPPCVPPRTRLALHEATKGTQWAMPTPPREEWNRWEAEREVDAMLKGEDYQYRPWPGVKP